MADSSSSAADYVSSEFCVLISGASMQNMATTTSVRLTVVTDADNGLPYAPYYFQCLNPNMGVGADGQGFQIYGGEPNTPSTLTPLSNLSITSRTMSFTLMKPQGNVKPQNLIVNLFLWAQGLKKGDNICMRVTCDPSFVLQYGWTHSVASHKLDTLNENIIQWGLD